ncbi:unnamed protein product [Amoebophrya sp. A25]|nr:unnamed protein product [Amoebophrya sp. A25]|eukprot:GSA25T00007275001.1
MHHLDFIMGDVAAPVKDQFQGKSLKSEVDKKTSRQHLRKDSSMSGLSASQRERLEEQREMNKLGGGPSPSRADDMSPEQDTAASVKAAMDAILHPEKSNSRRRSRNPRMQHIDVKLPPVPPHEQHLQSFSKSLGIDVVPLEELAKTLDAAVDFLDTEHKKICRGSGGGGEAGAKHDKEAAKVTPVSNTPPASVVKNGATGVSSPCQQHEAGATPTSPASVVTSATTSRTGALQRPHTPTQRPAREQLENKPSGTVKSKKSFVHSTSVTFNEDVVEIDEQSRSSEEDSMRAIPQNKALNEQPLEDANYETAEAFFGGGWQTVEDPHRPVSPTFGNSEEDDDNHDSRMSATTTLGGAFSDMFGSSEIPQAGSTVEDHGFDPPGFGSPQGGYFPFPGASPPGSSSSGISFGTVPVAAHKMNTPSASSVQGSSRSSQKTATPTIAPGGGSSSYGNFVGKLPVEDMTNLETLRETYADEQKRLLQIVKGQDSSSAATGEGAEGPNSPRRPTAHQMAKMDGLMREGQAMQAKENYVVFQQPSVRQASSPRSREDLQVDTRSTSTKNKIFGSTTTTSSTSSNNINQYVTSKSGLVPDRTRDIYAPAENSLYSEGASRHPDLYVPDAEHAVAVYGAGQLQQLELTQAQGRGGPSCSPRAQQESSSAFPKTTLNGPLSDSPNTVRNMHGRLHKAPAKVGRTHRPQAYVVLKWPTLNLRNQRGPALPLVFGRDPVLLHPCSRDEMPYLGHSHAPCGSKPDSAVARMDTRQPAVNDLVLSNGNSSFALLHPRAAPLGNGSTGGGPRSVLLYTRYGTIMPEFPTVQHIGYLTRKIPILWKREMERRATGFTEFDQYRVRQASIVSVPTTELEKARSGSKSPFRVGFDGVKAHTHEAFAHGTSRQDRSTTQEHQNDLGKRTTQEPEDLLSASWSAGDFSNVSLSPILEPQRYEFYHEVNDGTASLTSLLSNTAASSDCGSAIASSCASDDLQLVGGPFASAQQLELDLQKQGSIPGPSRLTSTSLLELEEQATSSRTIKFFRGHDEQLPPPGAFIQNLKSSFLEGAFTQVVSQQSSSVLDGRGDVAWMKSGGDVLVAGAGSESKRDKSTTKKTFNYEDNVDTDSLVSQVRGDQKQLMRTSKTTATASTSRPTAPASSTLLSADEVSGQFAIACLNQDTLHSDFHTTDAGVLFHFVAPSRTTGGSSSISTSNNTTSNLMLYYQEEEEQVVDEDHGIVHGNIDMLEDILEAESQEGGFYSCIDSDEEGSFTSPRDDFMFDESDYDFVLEGGFDEHEQVEQDIDSCGIIRTLTSTSSSTRSRSYITGIGKVTMIFYNEEEEEAQEQKLEQAPLAAATPGSADRGLLEVSSVQQDLALGPQQQQDYISSRPWSKQVSFASTMPEFTRLERYAAKAVEVVPHPRVKLVEPSDPLQKADMRLTFNDYMPLRVRQSAQFRTKAVERELYMDMVSTTAAKKEEQQRDANMNMMMNKAANTTRFSSTAMSSSQLRTTTTSEQSSSHQHVHGETTYKTSKSPLQSTKNIEDSFHPYGGDFVQGSLWHPHAQTKNLPGKSFLNLKPKAVYENTGLAPDCRRPGVRKVQVLHRQDAAALMLDPVLDNAVLDDLYSPAEGPRTRTDRRAVPPGRNLYDTSRSNGKIRWNLVDEENDRTFNRAARWNNVEMPESTTEDMFIRAKMKQMNQMQVGSPRRGGAHADPLLIKGSTGSSGSGAPVRNTALQSSTTWSTTASSFFGSGAETFAASRSMQEDLYSGTFSSRQAKRLLARPEKWHFPALSKEMMRKRGEFDSLLAMNEEFPEPEQAVMMAAAASASARGVGSPSRAEDSRRGAAHLHHRRGRGRNASDSTNKISVRQIKAGGSAATRTSSPPVSSENGATSFENNKPRRGRQNVVDQLQKGVNISLMEGEVPDDDEELTRTRLPRDVDEDGDEEDRPLTTEGTQGGQQHVELDQIEGPATVEHAPVEESTASRKTSTTNVANAPPPGAEVVVPSLRSPRRKRLFNSEGRDMDALHLTSPSGLGQGPVIGTRVVGALGPCPTGATSSDVLATAGNQYAAVVCGQRGFTPVWEDPEPWKRARDAMFDSLVTQGSPEIMPPDYPDLYDDRRHSVQAYLLERKLRAAARGVLAANRFAKQQQYLEMLALARRKAMLMAMGYYGKQGMQAARNTRNLVLDDSPLRSKWGSDMLDSLGVDTTRGIFQKKPRARLKNMVHWMQFAMLGDPELKNYKKIDFSAVYFGGGVAPGDQDPSMALTGSSFGKELEQTGSMEDGDAGQGKLEQEENNPWWRFPMRSIFAERFNPIMYAIRDLFALDGLDKSSHTYSPHSPRGKKQAKKMLEDDERFGTTTSEQQEEPEQDKNTIDLFKSRADCADLGQTIATLIAALCADDEVEALGPITLSLPEGEVAQKVRFLEKLHDFAESTRLRAKKERIVDLRILALMLKMSCTRLLLHFDFLTKGTLFERGSSTANTFAKHQALAGIMSLHRPSTATLVEQGHTEASARTMRRMNRAAAASNKRGMLQQKQTGSSTSLALSSSPSPVGGGETSSNKDSSSPRVKTVEHVVVDTTTGRSRTRRTSFQRSSSALGLGGSSGDTLLQQPGQQGQGQGQQLQHPLKKFRASYSSMSLGEDPSQSGGVNGNAGSGSPGPAASERKMELLAMDALGQRHSITFLTKEEIAQGGAFRGSLNGRGLGADGYLGMGDEHVDLSTMTTSPSRGPGVSTFSSSSARARAARSSSTLSIKEEPEEAEAQEAAQEQEQEDEDFASTRQQIGSRATARRSTPDADRMSMTSYAEELLIHTSGGVTEATDDHDHLDLTHLDLNSDPHKIAQDEATLKARLQELKLSICPGGEVRRFPAGVDLSLLGETQTSANKRPRIRRVDHHASSSSRPTSSRRGRLSLQIETDEGTGATPAEERSRDDDYYGPTSSTGPPGDGTLMASSQGDVGSYNYGSTPPVSTMGASVNGNMLLSPSRRTTALGVGGNLVQKFSTSERMVFVPTPSGGPQRSGGTLVSTMEAGPMLLKSMSRSSSQPNLSKTQLEEGAKIESKPPEETPLYHPISNLVRKMGLECFVSALKTKRMNFRSRDSREFLEDNPTGVRVTPYMISLFTELAQETKKLKHSPGMAENPGAQYLEPGTVTALENLSLEMQLKKRGLLEDIMDKEWKVKVDQVFKALDADNSGYVVRAEMQEWFMRSNQGRSSSPLAARRGGRRAGRMWNDRADDVVKPSDNSSPYLEVVENIFAEIDDNGDGLISYDEWVLYFAELVQQGRIPIAQIVNELDSFLKHGGYAAIGLFNRDHESQGKREQERGGRQIKL